MRGKDWKGWQAADYQAKSSVRKLAVMPNHFHEIIINTGKYPADQGDHPVGANTQVRPYRMWCNGLKP
jgi:hypothetical protein